VEIQMQKVESSQIEAVGYDVPSRTLAIQFKAMGDQPGAVYHYENVDAQTYDELSMSDSVGSYFYKNIKAHPDKYPYTKQEE
jgi:hypothetical protein